MSKKYSKADLEKLSDRVFNDYPKSEKVFATTDGQFFLNENRARLHLGGKGTIVEIARIDVMITEPPAKKTVEPVKKKSAEDLITDAKTIETVELVELALEVETKGKNRKTVVDAYNERLTELKAAK